MFVTSTRKGRENYGTINARVRKSGIIKKCSLSYCITVEEWDNYRLHKYQSNSIMPSIGITYDQFVHILEKIKHYIDNEYTTGELKEKISQIKTEVLHGSQEAIQSKRSRGFFLDMYIKQYYDDLISGKRLKVGRTTKVKPSSAKAFKTLLKKLMKFQRAKYRRYKLEDIDMQFQREFVVYLKKKGHFPNGIHTLLKNLWTVMRSAFEDHYTEHDITVFREFVTREVPIEDISLTPEQIDILYNLDISTVEKVQELINANVTSTKKRDKFLSEVTPKRVQTLNNCRDIFLVGIHTGQRISDYSRINKSMITRLKDEWFIRIVQRKTGKKVYIPLSQRVKDILDRHDGVLPDISTSCLNDYLGRLFEIIGWDWKPKIDKSRMGRKRGERFCDMVSSHTARRSFATNAYTSGINIASIMAVTGHSTERMFRRYLKLGTEDRAMKAAEDLACVMQLD